LAGKWGRSKLAALQALHRRVQPWAGAENPFIFRSYHPLPDGIELAALVDALVGYAI